jgi:two-component system CheB/CheR fusion protein
LLADDLTEGMPMTVAKHRPVKARKIVSEAPVSAEAVMAEPFAVVAIGASAGGLSAFEAFFSGLPADLEPDMAFILVQHLPPEHKSLLPELIRRYTRLPVFEVADGMAVQKNCVYITPPNADMALLHGHLHLLPPTDARGHRLPIDHLFCSLALDMGPRVVAVVLSGTGSDGTQGMRAVKDAGGLLMVQSPEDAEFDGMPRSAIETALVDYQLPAAQMAARLLAYGKHAQSLLQSASQPLPVEAESALCKIYILLRSQTGHDFSQYKLSTVQRRIERRMAVQQLLTLDAYADFSLQHPDEVQALFQDLLIGVTSFFRDSDAFLALETEVIPKLFTAKPRGGVIRVWSAGCSTGEEAYSIAMLLKEQMERLRQSYSVQVFATDIDSRAITSARSGVFAASIAEHISPERLARFFSLEPGGGGYRIHKGIRDMLIFSEQDLIKDPPFSRLDLISCRNLLIYLDGPLHKRLIPLFHFALNPHGLLFLGSSEGIGEFDRLFTVLDRKAKLYQRKADFIGERRGTKGQYFSPVMATAATLPRVVGKSERPVKLPLRELTEQALLAQITPAAALVSGNGDIHYLHGCMGQYLELVAGEAGVNNILKMAREGLSHGLLVSLHKAVAEKVLVSVGGLNLKVDGHYQRMNLSVRPLPVDLEVLPAARLFLVVLEPAPEPLSEPSPGDHASQALISALREELLAKDEFLQSTHEELQSSNEQLKSSNEEMQSVNEELQSTNEELETSKEELQSVNEELATVNNELQLKVQDLSRLNNDMNNLLAGTGIATVFVDLQLQILRFTPTAEQIINLIASDIGRPLGHIVSNLQGYDQLVADARGVLDTLTPYDSQVQSRCGRWYAMRLRPYRTLDNVIEGVVISFVDISELKAAEQALREANHLLRLAVVARSACDAVIVQNINGQISAWNPSAECLYGWSEAEALQLNGRERIPEGLREDMQNKLQRLNQAEVLPPFRSQRLSKSAALVDVWVSVTGLMNEAGQLYAFAILEQAVTADKIRS